MKRTIIAIAVASTLAQWRTAGAAIEARLAPVIGRQSVTVVSRTSTLACFDWRFEKLRRLGPERTSAFVIAGGDVIDSVPLISDATGLRYIHQSRASPVGPGERRICIDMLRSQIAPQTPLTLKVTVIYRGLGHLWDVPYDIPPVTWDGAP